MVYAKITIETIMIDCFKGKKQFMRSIRDKVIYTTRKLVPTEKFTLSVRYTDYTWDTLPLDLPGISKEITTTKYGMKYYTAIFKETDEDMPGSCWLHTLKQTDCPQATFRTTVRYDVLNKEDYSLKELFENEPAETVIEFFKDHGISVADLGVVLNEK